MFIDIHYWVNLFTIEAIDIHYWSEWYVIGYKVIYAIICRIKRDIIDYYSIESICLQLKLKTRYWL